MINKANLLRVTLKNQHNLILRPSGGAIPGLITLHHLSTGLPRLVISARPQVVLRATGRRHHHGESSEVICLPGCVPMSAALQADVVRARPTEAVR